MTSRTRTATLSVLVGLAAVACLALAGDVRGDAKGALEKAEKRGQELWKKSWKPGAKSCSACHDRGPNKMTAARLNGYPKYDKRMKRVVTGQQKLNQMIEKNSKGEPLELGSDDLNALEAYVKSRR